MFDLIIKNGKIIDGTGSPFFLADIGIKDGKIAKIGRNLGDAKNMIDAKGLTVTPGFIDSHSHSDNYVLSFPDVKEKAEQGITTSVGGQCGSAPAPLHRDTKITEENKVFSTMGSFLDAAKNTPQGSNLVPFAGHCAIRASVMGYENRVPTQDELEKMKAHVHDAFEHGVAGLSFGLIYFPGSYAQTDELIELARVAAEYNGIISAHIRDEGDELVRAVEEFIEIIKASGARGVISHHKSMEKKNWGKVSHTLRMIEEANENGLEIYCDCYPYTASHTSLHAHFIPKEYTSNLDFSVTDTKTRQHIRKINFEKYGTDLSWVLMSTCQKHPEFEGKTLNEIAQMQNKDVYDAIFDIIKDGGTCNACYFTMCEEDIEAVLKFPRAMVCTDSSIAGNKSFYHPRLRGTFPRVLGRYVRERKVTSLADMIRKMTSLPAAVYGLHGKGLLREGFDADICIFDADKICDRAEYTDCTKKAAGLNYVIIDGKIAVKNSEYLGERYGKVLIK